MPDPASSASALNYVRTGPRHAGTVVLIHPVGLDLTYWDAQIDALRTTHDVVAFDLRGHGRSPGTAADVSFERFSADLVGLLDQLGVDAAHVVGVSVGGMIAQTLALSHPRRVRSLSLLATAATFPEAGRATVRSRAGTIRDGGMRAVVTPFLERWFTPETIARRPHLMDRITKTYLADDPAVQARMWEMIADLQTLDRLGEVRCPTLVVVGDRDPSTPPPCSAAIAAAIPQARHVVVPNASHLIHLECPDVTNALVLEFLSSQ